MGVVDAYGNFLWHDGPSQLKLEPVAESSVKTDPQVDFEAMPKRPSSARRADLLFDLMEEIALVNADKIDPETAAVGITVRYEDLINNRRVLTLTDQESTLTGEAVRRLCCDAGIHRLVIQGVSEFLDIGRKTRTWTTAQRRAIRDGTTTAAPRKAAAAASPTSTTSNGGKTAATPPSTTASPSAPTTTASSTKANGPSPSTPTPA